MGNLDGRFVWYELASLDVEAAKAFYTDVIGWGAMDASMPGAAYILFTAGGIPVAGLMNLPEVAKQAGGVPQWLGYAGVAGVDAAANRAAQLGGTVRIPPMDVPGISRFTIIADPEGATLALIKGREDAQPRRAKPGTPGHVAWHELLASDGESVFAFYHALLGWTKAEAHTGPEGTYQPFSAGGETIGGIFTKRESVPWSLWVYYFEVEDLDAAAKRVQALGGEVLYGPVPVPGGARIVHCADAGGAVFGLIDTRMRVSIGCYAPRS